MYKPPYKISNQMLNYCISISEKISLLSNYHTFNKMLLLRRNNKIKSIHSSLMIEANSLSLEQVRDVINGKTVLGPLKEIQEVKNAYNAYDKISGYNPYSEQDLLIAHKELTYLLCDDNGRYRNHGEGVFDGNELIFIAPPAELVPSHMQDLFYWLKNDEDTPLLIKSCVFHYEFVYIHPFSDGNGRTARLWQNVILSKWYKIFEYVPIESQIQKYQNDYYDAILKSNEEGNSNCFIEFMLKVIDETLIDLLDCYNKETCNISPQVNKLLEAIEYDVSYSANELLERLDIKSKETLRNSYLNPAIENGLIKMTLPDKPNSKNQKYYKS